jgi:hypothetical protein
VGDAWALAQHLLAHGRQSVPHTEDRMGTGIYSGLLFLKYSNWGQVTRMTDEKYIEYFSRVIKGRCHSRHLNVVGRNGCKEIEREGMD